MSSSSALVVAVALSIIDHNDIREREEWKANVHDDIDLAGYMATMENGLTFGTLKGLRGVGTFGGSEDHTAMLCCHEGKLTEFTFCPIEEGESVDLPAEWSFVVAVSGVLAEKTGAALESYNNASIAASDEALTKRLTAFVTESEVAIPQAVKALKAGDFEAFGQMRFSSS